ncbi:MAG: phosphatidate cytidylyltransferase [Dokdonella sp.]|uniref:phosphatidate cytidylyltransferase n=1 Tax=Dokdonella sp. TaxID=2291710 RepID=UPI0025B89653|nr:phosphatidate cytidylyltransferase [Dokdonella sp.]MBZ0222602.1 phosphatidate cytidylyltransferase [Dokdonella sp.]MCC7255001.1 phosphatidate cytidylyltransferase [Dokdonella sp.]
MNSQEKFYWLFGGILSLLVLASCIGALLHWRARGNETIANLNARVRAWWVMVAIIAVNFVLGTNATVVLFALASLFALREFITLTPTRPGDYLPLVACFYVLLPVQYWLIAADWYNLFAIFLPVYGFLLLPVLAAVSGDTEDFLARVTKVQWGLMITVYCISYAPALLLVEVPGFSEQPRNNLLLMIYLLTIVQMSDVLQYVFGKLLGKHKIAPKVSPSKTVEGFVGGGLAATGLGTALWWITPFTPLQACGMAAAIVVSGFLGGLALSAVKRSLGAKDWGAMIEGHGGMLDRLDSVSFAAPIFFHLTRYFFEP